MRKAAHKRRRTEFSFLAIISQSAIGRHIFKPRLSTDAIRHLNCSGSCAKGPSAFLDRPGRREAASHQYGTRVTIKPAAIIRSEDGCGDDYSLTHYLVGWKVELKKTAA
jgi:hypothetical protein